MYMFLMLLPNTPSERWSEVSALSVRSFLFKDQLLGLRPIFPWVESFPFRLRKRSNLIHYSNAVNALFRIGSWLLL
jgi:hypothetical protein